jgi:site-specific DNA-methyltransferase (adenine-specific)
MIAEPLRPLARPITEFRLLDGNPRRGDVAACKRSLSRFGQRKPIVVRDDGTVEAGNTTLKAALELGWTELAAVAFTDDDATAKAFALADNRTSELGSFDLAALAAMAVDVQAADPGLLEAASYSEADLNALLAGLRVPEKRTDPDAVPDAPAEPVTVLGDLWLLGPHRLACGDSTDPALWDRILDGDRPRLVFTDPPYGIGYVAMRGGAAIANDKNASEALQVTRDALALFHDAEAHFVCCDWRSLSTIIDAMLAAAIEPRACIVWDKQRRVQNLDRYAKQHEFIVYAGPYGGQATLCTDVWCHPRDFEPDHSTPKPVSLIEQALTTASRPGALVADLFAGSGSTLIAAHGTGRVVALAELEPRNCDVICRRYQEHAGTKPVLESTGQPHDFTA